MLIENGRLVSGLHVGADQHHGYMSAAMGRVAGCRLVKGDDQQAIPARLEGWAGEQGREIGLQKGVCLCRGAVVRIVQSVGNDVSQVGQVVGGQVGGELRERHEIGRLAGAVSYVGEVGKRVVANVVRSVAAASGNVAARVTHGRKRLGIRLPGFAGCHHVTDDIVRADRRGERVIIIGGVSAGGDHEVVVDRGMVVAVIIGRQTILRRQAVQVVPNRAASDYAAGALVLFHNQNHMIACWDLRKSCGNQQDNGCQRREGR